MLKKVLIFAAGKGNQMCLFTENQPKLLLLIVDVPLLKKKINELIKIGINEIYFVIGYKKGMYLVCTYIYIKSPIKC